MRNKLHQHIYEVLGVETPWEDLDFKQHHQCLWMWLSKHPEKDKRDFFITFKVMDIPDSHCYACEYMKRNNLSCNECPIAWPIINGVISCTSCTSAYYKWRHATSREELTQYAEQIANIEWRLPDERRK